MAEQHKFIARREPTPMPGRPPTTRTTGRLPDDLVSEQVERLALFSLLGAALWTTGLVMDQLMLLTTPIGFPLEIWKSHLIEILGIVTSGAMFGYTRYARHSPQTKADVGLAYMVLIAAFIAALNTWVAAPPTRAQMMQDRKSTRLNSSHTMTSRMPSSA